ncbi:hypothetical protein A8D95_34225 [Burkholderia cenocepacia]|uniref:Uncharacterized protein n=1 Tax=Burkholderia cenocepacia TaxID=95486 RepID=A0A1V2VYT6_9BURK|nr:hypothetical protein A8D83_37970 [Burkholderia cenocepacia]ONJ23527.1 hypothetical protein A8D90_32850 [Burkholderia cenocepacia]ONP15977.1 hypothetical protein A8D84_38280 [Burkholderia cenocepacia]ONP27702.1 hypothetical protein A8D85_37030 [Burkholderia cenocepacia]ONP27871.1 hypothetical protein A8D86_36280 [Burkholderia cenocepacia]
MVLCRHRCNCGRAASALAGAEPSKLRGFAGGRSGCPASRSFQGHSMTVDSYAYCPSVRAVSGVLFPTPINSYPAGGRQEAGR